MSRVQKQLLGRDVRGSDNAISSPIIELGHGTSATCQGTPIISWDGIAAGDPEVCGVQGIAAQCLSEEHELVLLRPDATVLGRELGNNIHSTRPRAQ